MVVTDTLPLYTTYVTGSASDGGTYNAGQRKVTWTLAGELAAGAQVTRSFHVTVDAVPAGVTSITNTATAADDGNNGADPTPGDNTGTDTDTLTAAPDLTVTKTDGRSTAAPGDDADLHHHDPQRGQPGRDGRGGDRHAAARTRPM